MASGPFWTVESMQIISNWTALDILATIIFASKSTRQRAPRGDFGCFVLTGYEFEKFPFYFIGQYPWAVPPGTKPEPLKRINDLDRVAGVLPDRGEVQKSATSTSRKREW
jgi:hypothetical protein